jgi:hypothetical protein
MEADMAFLPALTGRWQEPRGPFVRLHALGRHGRSLRLNFVFSREMVDALGWQAGERFVFSLGVGDDLGRMQLSRGRRGSGCRLIANNNARGFRLCFTLPPLLHGVDLAALLERQLLPATLDHEAGNGALLLSLPDMAALEASPRLNGARARPAPQAH